jgi:hypothetical protein
MPFWTRLFGRGHFTQDLHDQIAAFLAGLGFSLEDAREMATSCIDAAKQEARKEGSVPANAGDTFLQREATDERTREWLEKKRSEGVTTEDIRWYWNLNDLERRSLEQMYKAILYATWKNAVQDGRTSEHAAIHARKFHPYYGEPDDTRVTSGDDRPLPIELMGRENAWFEKARSQGLDALRQRLQKSSSYNALMRTEIRARRL